jgi:glyoxylase-like metal-dependent hydrolase (beta-lactamase superfamily II)
LSIEQIKVGFDNFCYLIFCEKSKKAAIVDPGFGIFHFINNIIKRNLLVHYIILTHHHSDHTSGINIIKNKFPSARLVASKNYGRGFDVDVFVSDNDSLKIGNVNLKFILTPGHTPDGICIIVDDKAIITGDTLFIGDCGRCDLPDGGLSQMFQSLQKIKTLSNDLIVYPGHDYGNKPFDTLGNQKKTNKTLRVKNLVDFSKIP